MKNRLSILLLLFTFCAVNALSAQEIKEKRHQRYSYEQMSGELHKACVEDSFKKNNHQSL